MSPEAIDFAEKTAVYAIHHLGLLTLSTLFVCGTAYFSWRKYFKV